MAVRSTEVNLTYEELAALYAERDLLVLSLREQVRALELERVQLRGGVEALTRALRRRGCCEVHLDRPV